MDFYTWISKLVMVCRDFIRILRPFLVIKCENLDRNEIAFAWDFHRAEESFFFQFEK